VNPLEIEVSQDLIWGSVLTVKNGETLIIRGSNDLDRFTLDAKKSRTFFKIENGGTLIISKLVLQNGYSYDDEGAIYNKGTFTSTDCLFSGNKAGDGGAVYNAGTFTATNCAFSGNRAFSFQRNGGGGDRGGAVFNLGTFTLTDCKFSGNTAGRGDDINNYAGAIAVLRSCSFSNDGTIFGQIQGCPDSGNDDWCGTGGAFCREYENRFGGSSWGVYCLSPSPSASPSAIPSASPSASPSAAGALKDGKDKDEDGKDKDKDEGMDSNGAAPRTGAAFALLLASTSVLLLQVC